MKINDLKKRKKAAFMKEAQALADDQIRILTHHISNSLIKYTAAIYSLAEKYLAEVEDGRREDR